MKRFNKTLSIALAVGVSFGGVAVAAPTAGAVGGYTPDEIMPDNPYKNNYGTWGFIGGYVQGVLVKDGKVNGFSSGLGHNALSMFTNEYEKGVLYHGYYSDPIVLDSVVVSNPNFSFADVVPSVALSTDLKKVIYAIALINNDIVENEGLSQDVKDLFAHVGYSPDEGVGSFGEKYGLVHTHKKSKEYIESLGNPQDMDAYATQADVVAGASAALLTYIFNHGTDWTDVDDLGSPKDPTSLTLEQFRKQDYVSDMLAGSTLEPIEWAYGLAPLAGEKGQKSADVAALYNAFLDISELVSDEAVNSDSVMLRSYVPDKDDKSYSVPNDILMPWLIDFDASDVPSVTTLLPDIETAPDPEPEVPAEDLHVTNVEKLDDGNYKLIRSDGKTWTVDLKDIRDKITALEKKKTVSPEDLKKVQDELAKVKNGIDGLNDKNAEINTALDGLRNDLNSLGPRVKNLEDRVTKLEKITIKEVRDNGDGTYTLIREDNTEVKGTIDTGDSVIGIKDNGDGSITITRVGGTSEKVNLARTKVVEDKAKHTVTITTPDGKQTVINTFDTFVTDVKKQDNGDYVVTQNNGKKWTINLKDIREKISALETGKANKAEVDEIKKNLAELTKQVGGNLDNVIGDADELKKDLAALDGRVTTLESKVEDLEKNQITKVVGDKGKYTLTRQDGSVVEGCLHVIDSYAIMVYNEIL